MECGYGLKLLKISFEKNIRKKLFFKAQWRNGMELVTR